MCGFLGLSNVKTCLKLIVIAFYDSQIMNMRQQNPNQKINLIFHVQTYILSYENDYLFRQFHFTQIFIILIPSCFPNGYLAIEYVLLLIIKLLITQILLIALNYS